MVCVPHVLIQDLVEDVKVVQLEVDLYPFSVGIVDHELVHVVGARRFLIHFVQDASVSYRAQLLAQLQHVAVLRFLRRACGLLQLSLVEKAVIDVRRVANLVGENEILKFVFSEISGDFHQHVDLGSFALAKLASVVELDGLLSLDGSLGESVISDSVPASENFFGNLDLDTGFCDSVDTNGILSSVELSSIGFTKSRGKNSLPLRMNRGQR